MFQVSEIFGDFLTACWIISFNQTICDILLMNSTQLLIDFIVNCLNGFVLFFEYSERHLMIYNKTFWNCMKTIKLFTFLLPAHIYFSEKPNNNKQTIYCSKADQSTSVFESAKTDVWKYDGSLGMDANKSLEWSIKCDCCSLKWAKIRESIASIALSKWHLWV